MESCTALVEQWLLKLPTSSCCLCLVIATYTHKYIANYRYTPSKNALARSCKKRSFFLAPLQDLAGSCGILRDLVGFCRNLAGFLHKIPARFLQNSCKIPQDPAGSCKILQGCKKKDLFLQDLARAFLLGIQLLAIAIHTRLQCSQLYNLQLVSYSSENVCTHSLLYVHVCMACKYMCMAICSSLYSYKLGYVFIQLQLVIKFL